LFSSIEGNKNEKKISERTITPLRMTMHLKKQEQLYNDSETTYRKERNYLNENN